MTKRAKATILLSAVTAIAGGFGRTAAAAPLFPSCPSGWYYMCATEEQVFDCEFDGGSDHPTATCDALLYATYHCSGDVGEEYCDGGGDDNSDCPESVILCVVRDS